MELLAQVLFRGVLRRSSEPTEARVRTHTHTNDHVYAKPVIMFTRNQ